MALERHRDREGQISRTLGDTLIGTLREHYGASFAQGCSESEKLTDVLGTLDDLSLIRIARDHAAGKLEQFCSQAA
jgi:hypothetical protein